MRFAVDTGGTFTDLLIEDEADHLRMYKSSTTPADPIRGMLDGLGLAAAERGTSLRHLLGQGELFIHGTTHAINAIITGRTARTAFVTTAGHPDTLVFREGGRSDVFNFTVPYPDPYVPRELTFEVPERVMVDGSVRTPLDEAAVLRVIERLRELEVEAVGVCLLWSIANPSHELRVGELLSEHIPDIPFTLSHQLNPSLREYRRASSTCIDASLKPMMSRYVGRLTGTLRDEGFSGRVLMVTSQAGVMDAAEVAEAPVHLINSGPSMAPVAGWLYSRGISDREMAIVADTGGTTFDISLVRRGRIPRTRETWIGAPFRGHMTGLPSVDVKSIGAGGGSIASVDTQGLLQVGPRSAGAVPGPVCYGRGGTEPTLTDAALVLGIIDPDFFLGGSIPLDRTAASEAIRLAVADRLRLGVAEAAYAILALATENMVQAIMDITVNQGIDPRQAVLVGGGGAAGLNMAMIGRRLRVAAVVIPPVGAALSAAGALLSDLASEHRATLYVHTARFDVTASQAVLAQLGAKARMFVEGPGRSALASSIEYAVEARYPDQVWEIEIPVVPDRLRTADDLRAFERSFHVAHEEVFAVADPDSPVEIVGWAARAMCVLRPPGLPRLVGTMAADSSARGTRPVFFGAEGVLATPILRLDMMRVDEPRIGPAIVESPFTTVVVDPGTLYRLTSAGSLVLEFPAASSEGVRQ